MYILFVCFEVFKDTVLQTIYAFYWILQNNDSIFISILINVYNVMEIKRQFRKIHLSQNLLHCLSVLYII